MFNFPFNKVSVLLLAFYLFLSSCITNDLYQESISFPDHEWKSDLKAEFEFTISDTISKYDVYFIMRHTEKYNYKNIWMNYYYQPPGDTAHKETREFELATNEKGWLGTGMDDIYEHRMKLSSQPGRLRAGKYRFILENIMREDPLLHVLNVGIRLEKIK